MRGPFHRCFNEFYLFIFLYQLRVENIRKERDILKQVENRLSQEKESVLTEQRGQNLLLTNLKSIQVQLVYISQPTLSKHSSALFLISLLYHSL